MKPDLAFELCKNKAHYKTNTKNIYSAYKDLPIETFLKKCLLYNDNSSEWIVLKKLSQDAQESQSHLAERYLYEPLSRIIEAILDYFYNEEDSHLRWITETHKKSMKYEEEQDDDAIKTSPDLSVMGGSPSLSGREVDVDIPQYAHCIAPVEVKTDANLNERDVLLQIAVYSRQCFNQQPHRRYVPAVVLTESQAHIHVYDRSGMLRLIPAIDIHADAIAFVRAIIGISTVCGGFNKHNEFQGPFDPNVRWVADTDYPQIQVYNQWTNEMDDKESDHGDSEDSDANSEASSDWDSDAPEDEAEESDAEHENSAKVLTNSTKKSEELDQELECDCSARKSLISNLYNVTSMRFVRRMVTGRGTVCWNAIDAETGQAILIKDSWRPFRRTAEWKLLMQIKDMDGVSQMIAFEDGCQSGVEQFRRFICEGIYVERPYLHNRRFSRIVLHAYGQSIRHFDNKLQLLYAFRDAVAGHRNLWMRGILHRDVSIDNILLGQDGSKEGNRGVLIDLDLAIRVDRVRKLSQHLIRTGTRAFQSVAVLSPEGFGDAPPPQDHLDDLESFFYILTWICLKYNGPHTTHRDSMTSTYLDKWEAPDAVICSSVKAKFLMFPTIIMLQQYFNNEIFKTLLRSLAAMCCQHYLEKIAISSNQTTPPTLIDVHQEAQATHHDAFLRCIDEAIQKQKNEKVDWVLPPAPPPMIGTKRAKSKNVRYTTTRKTPNGDLLRHKRRGDDDDSRPPSKRLKVSKE